MPVQCGWSRSQGREETDGGTSEVRSGLDSGGLFMTW